MPRQGFSLDVPLLFLSLSLSVSHGASEQARRAGRQAGGQEVEECLLQLSG